MRPTSEAPIIEGCKREGMRIVEIKVKFSGNLKMLEKCEVKKNSGKETNEVNYVT